MPVLSLPVEIEQMIFLLCAEHEDRHTYLLVARRVQLWLEPILYRIVHLTTEKVAKKFLHSVKSHPKFAETTVKVLFFRATVEIETAGTILKVCNGIEDLTLRIPCHLIGKNPLLGPLDALQQLHTLSVDLASIFNNRVIYLPNIDVLHRVTHLHISNAWASWQGGSQTIGVEELEQVTHLSIHFSTMRTDVSILRGILERDNLTVMVLWRKASMTEDQIREWLRSHELIDRRIVILNSADFFSTVQSGGFWKNVESLVEWRRRTNAEAFETPNDS
ncbi:hypothetical protein PISMIDRAFT_17614 [Pisolithus microcarpus 441]|uniref:F-box domain-containing protein n=1 Tax=Pisolithus microcarpus 441 TaxID=765257 RepID=A0A0C9XNK5_9AGAM|nr:hypothetical protein PISMIDRAFT_17614 [Pisolithus microcarpus 441]